MQQNIPPIILNGKQLMKVTLMMYLNQSIIQLYQTYKSILERYQLDK